MSKKKNRYSEIKNFPYISGARRCILDDTFAGNKCINCSAIEGTNGTKLKMCKWCRATYYCDEHCQREDWNGSLFRPPHKETCTREYKNE